ncbi:MAG: aminotransferase class I/II-fold pyridoxal phosphate-dependent enzyme [Actinobacteria bacterium]|nr:aminotransferase class I/II-fold pyridoxal phosphate-dependent enzyme [Actinomycetota bacterium]
MTATSLRSVKGLELERFFWAHNGRAEHLLCASDVEPYRLHDLLELADEQTTELWRRLELGYTHPEGMPALRAEIAASYRGVDSEDVVTFAGADEAIFLALNAILRPGDHALVTWPAYQSLHEVAYAAGADVTLLPLDPTEGWALDVDALRRAIRPTTRVVIVNFPHNPTGALADRQTLDAVAAIAAEAGAHLFSDEVYRYLEHDPAELLPAAAEYGGRAVSVGVMSKAFGLAGLRIGWLATKDRELLRRISISKEYISSCNSAPSEVLALVALRAREAVLARSRRLLSANLALLDRFFADWEGVISWVRPRAGCVGFPQLQADLRVEALASRLVDEEGVLLVPGSVYDYPGNHFRLGFGRVDLPAALAGLDRFARREFAKRAA